MARLKVSRRPEWIIPMQEGRMFLSGWVNDISSSARLEYTATRTADGWVVAGEHTTLINLSHGKPTETIVTYMAFGSSLPNEKDDPPMAQTFRGMYEDYYEDLGVESHQYVVVYNYQDFRSPGKSGEWIAFNPIISQQLGWKPSEKQMFGWENDTGELMAFSRYWRDGNIEMHVHRYDNEVGEGWYTLISEKALAQLKAIRSPFFSLRRKITRETTYEGHNSDSFDQMIDEWE